jgi:K+-sensing histidine kinase KdpD
MRHPLCSMDVPAPDPLQARQRTRMAAALFGLAPLQALQWSAAVADLATAPSWQVAGATLTLWLDTGSSEMADLRLVAELKSPDVSSAEDWQHKLSRALQGEAHYPESGGTVLALAVQLPPGVQVPAEAQIESHARQLSALAETPLSAELAQQIGDLRTALSALEEEHVIHAETLRRNEEALAQLAHDLRSPLLTLNLNLEMLRLKPHNGEELEARREVMKRQADQLKAIAAGLVAKAGLGHGGKAPGELEQR